MQEAIDAFSRAFSRFSAKARFLALLMRYALRFSSLYPIRKTTVLLICHDDDRGYVWCEKRYAQLLDSINELLTERNINTLTLAAPYSKHIGGRAFGDVVAVHGEFARAQLKCLLYRVVRHLVPIKRDPLVELWTGILQRAKPRFIIGIEPSRHLCVAAKKYGVPVAELQHGFLADTIDLYSIAYRQKGGGAAWPDYLLSWNEESAKWMERQSGGQTIGKVIGNPWLIRFRFPKQSDRLVNDLLVVDQGFCKERPIILVSCQWGGSTLDYHPIGIPNSLLDVIKSGRLKCSWLLRLHPVQMQDGTKQAVIRHLEAEFQGNTNVSWEPWSSLPLPSVLSATDLHITSHSSVTVEAEYFNIRTALLHQDVAMLGKYFAHQISRGSADVVRAGRDEIIHWVEENSNVEGRNKEAGISCSRATLDSFVSWMVQVATAEDRVVLN